MKKNKSMLGAVVVATILCVSVLASSVFATDSFEFTGGTVTKYTGTKTNVTIPSTDGGTTITTISANAFAGCDDVTVVYLPSTITTVEDGAFSGCSADVKVIFDMDSPTASVPAGMENWGVNDVGGTITYYMGSGNTTMTLSDAGKISGGNNSQSTTYAYIKDGTISSLLTPSEVDWRYQENTSIIYTNVGNADPNAICVSKDSDNTVMMWADINDLYFWFDADELVMPEDMMNYFDAWDSLTTINGMEFFDTSNVTNMSGMFQETGMLQSYDFSNFDTSSVTDMSRMFYGLGYLIDDYSVLVTNTILDISSFDISQDTVIDDFIYATHIETIYVKNDDIKNLLDNHSDAVDSNYNTLVVKK